MPCWRFQLLEDSHDLDAGLGVEISWSTRPPGMIGGLLMSARADGHALLLPPGSLVGMVRVPTLQADLPNRIRARACRSLVRRPPCKER